MSHRGSPFPPKNHSSFQQPTHQLAETAPVPLRALVEVDFSNSVEPVELAGQRTWLRSGFSTVFGEPSISHDFVISRISPLRVDARPLVAHLWSAWNNPSVQIAVPVSRSATPFPPSRRGGGSSDDPRARLRAEELANETDLRLLAPKSWTKTRRFKPSHDPRLPLPGAVITRQYKNETIVVTVLGTGFEFKGTVYRSLTAVAKAVTGQHWNGPSFFGLTKKKTKQ